MAATEDILQTAEGDWDVSSGDLRKTPDTSTLVVQGLSQNLQFWRGEWYLNILEGVPYFEAVIGQKFDRSLQTSIFRQACAKTLGVASVDALVLAFDGPTRALSVRGKCRATDGETVDFGPLVIGGVA